MSWRGPTMLVLCLAAAGCDQVEADHPLDPDTPTSKQHKARISGTLVFPTADGLPDEAGANDTRVQLFGGGNDEAAEFEVRIDANGGFRFEAIDPGLYRMHISAPGYVSDDRILSTSALEDFDVGRVVMRVEVAGIVLGTVSGRARLNGADNHAGTLVVAVDTGRVAVTAYDGQFALDVPPGDYTLLVRHDGYAAREVEVSVDTGGTELDAQVLLEPTSGSVSGTVTLRQFSSEPWVAAIEVSLETDGADPQVAGAAFAFADLAPGTYTLTANVDGFDRFSETLEVGPGEAHDAEIELNHASTGSAAVALEGTVTLSDGQAPGGTRVEVRAEPWNVPFASVVADSGGRFTLAAAADERYTLDVERDGYGPAVVGPVAYDAEDGRFEDEDGAPVSLTLDP